MCVPFCKDIWAETIHARKFKILKFKNFKTQINQNVSPLDLINPSILTVLLALQQTNDSALQ